MDSLINCKRVDSTILSIQVSQAADLPPIQESGTNEARIYLFELFNKIFQEAQQAAHSPHNKNNVDLSTTLACQIPAGMVIPINRAFQSVPGTLHWKLTGHKYDVLYGPQVNFGGMVRVALKSANLSWSADDLNLQPRPITAFVPALKLNGSSSWELAQAGRLTNYTFIFPPKEANGENIKVHVHKERLVYDSGFFEKLFLGEVALPNKNEGEFKFTDNVYEFRNLLQFIYTGQLSQEPSDLGGWLSLYCLASFTQTPALLEVCRYHLNIALNTESLLAISQEAFDANDEILLGLCRWYVRTHPDSFKTEIDLSNATMKDLLDWIELCESIAAVSHQDKGRKHHIDSWQEALCQAVETRYFQKVESFDPNNFVILCNVLKRNKTCVSLYKRLSEIAYNCATRDTLLASILTHESALSALTQLGFVEIGNLPRGEPLIRFV